MAKKTVTKRLKLRNVRCSYVFLDEPRAYGNDDKPMYSVRPIIKKGSKNHKLVKAVIREVQKEALPNLKKVKNFIQNGAKREEPEYKGMIFFYAKNEKPVGIVNQKAEPASMAQRAKYMFSGARFHISLTIFNYDHAKGGKGIACRLQGVMLFKKDDRLDGHIPAEVDFAEYADDSWTDDEDDDEGEGW